MLLVTQKKKTKRSAKKHNKLKATISLWLVSIFLLSGWVAIGSSYTGRQSSASPNIKISFKDESAYKNLDLSQAAKAEYKNQPFTIEKELGVGRNVDHKLIKFSIPNDNLSQYALMTVPTTPAPITGYPVLILCHGYVDPWLYSTLNAYLPDMEYYSKNGFVVIKPDFRGQGLSIDLGTPEGAYYSMAYNTDVLSLIAAIKETSYLNKKNISIWGHSMGGYIALRAAVVSNDIKNVIVLAAPVGYIQDMFSAYVAISDSSNPYAARIRAEALSRNGTPINNPDFWEKTSPLRYVDNLNAKVQIHVGQYDQVVPARFSADLSDALNKAGKEHQYYFYKNAGHGLVPQRSQIYQRSIDLLKKPNQFSTGLDSR